MRKEKMLICLLLYCLFCLHRSAAQNNERDPYQQFYKTISFGENIDFGDIDESGVWTVANAKKNIYITLRGSEINKYVFSEPGEYKIAFHEIKKSDDECNHPAYPENFIVKVEPVKMSFDFSKISFSDKFQRGRIYSDVIVSVPVEISAKVNSAAALAAPGLFITGLGVALTAEPILKEIAIDNKTKVLKYKISGTINQETYLMFDFYDFNNQAKTYNLPQLIK